MLSLLSKTYLSMLMVWLPLGDVTAARCTSGVLQFRPGYRWLTSKDPTSEDGLPCSSLSNLGNSRWPDCSGLMMSRGAHNVSSIYCYTRYIVFIRTELVLDWSSTQLNSHCSTPTCQPFPATPTYVTAQCFSRHHCCPLLCSGKVCKHIKNFYEALLSCDKPPSQ